MCSSEYGFIKFSVIMRLFRESTIPHFELATSLGDKLKTQFIGGQTRFHNSTDYRVPRIKIYLSANIAMKYEHKLYLTRNLYWQIKPIGSIGFTFIQINGPQP